MSKKQREKVEEEVSFHQAQNRVSLFEVVFVPVQSQVVLIFNRSPLTLLDPSHM
jgi:hypothetical protein